MVGLKAPLKEGASFPLELRFERAGTLNVNVPVKSIGAMGSSEHKGH